MTYISSPMVRARVGSVRGHRWVTAALLLAGLLGTAGCNHDEPPPPTCDIHPASKNGAQLFAEAKKRYAVTRVLDLNGVELRTEMEQVMAHIDGAIANDQTCPLFLAKRGEMFIEMGPDSYARGEADLRAAIKICQDWVPSYLGLANLSSRRGEYDAAKKWLEEAQKAIEGVEKVEKEEPVQPWRIFGIAIYTEDPKPGQDPNDPKLKKEQARKLLLTWLEESEQWTVDSPSLLQGFGGSGGMTVNKTNLFRRYRARVEFERLLMRLLGGESPDLVLSDFEKVYRWDADYFPARIENAVQLRRVGRYREAERFLRPYMDSRDPKIANNGRLLFEMACIYAEWYANNNDTKEDATLAVQANDYFCKLLGDPSRNWPAVNQHHGQAWLKRASFNVTAGTKARNTGTLQDARQWLKNARECIGKETPEMAEVSQQIERAERSLKSPPKGANP